MTHLPPSILARGVDSMNFYYGPRVCHLLWLFSFDRDRYQCALEMHHLKTLPLGKKNHYQQSCVPSFCFIILKSEGKSAQWVAHIGFLCLFVFLLQITIPK